MNRAGIVGKGCPSDVPGAWLSIALRWRGYKFRPFGGLWGGIGLCGQGGARRVVHSEGGWADQRAAAGRTGIRGLPVGGGRGWLEGRWIEHEA